MSAGFGCGRYGFEGRPFWLLGLSYSWLGTSTFTVLDSLLSEILITLFMHRPFYSNSIPDIPRHDGAYDNIRLKRPNTTTGSLFILCYLYRLRRFLLHISPSNLYHPQFILLPLHFLQARLSPARSVRVFSCMGCRKRTGSYQFHYR